MTHIIMQCKSCKYTSADRLDSKREYKRKKKELAIICPKCEGRKFDIKTDVHCEFPHEINNLWLCTQWLKQNTQ